MNSQKCLGKRQIVDQLEKPQSMTTTLEQLASAQKNQATGRRTLDLASVTNSLRAKDSITVVKDIQSLRTCDQKLLEQRPQQRQLFKDYNLGVNQSCSQSVLSVQGIDSKILSSQRDSIQHMGIPQLQNMDLLVHDINSNLLRNDSDAQIRFDQRPYSVQNLSFGENQSSAESKRSFRYGVVQSMDGLR